MLRPFTNLASTSDPNNFRPISVLPIISKLFERHICAHLMLYLRSFNLIVSTQSGFCPHHSTESILIRMTDDWLEAMDQDLLTGAIFLDLRKALDVVYHDLLAAKLRMYGCSSSASDRGSKATCQTVDSVSTLQEPYLILRN